MAHDTDAAAVYDRHDIELRDIADADDPRCPDEMHGCLVVSYNTSHTLNATYSEGRHVSTRLPLACLAVFDDGVVDVTDLSAFQRAWLRAESAAYSNEIDFSGTDNGPAVAVGEL
jgi:hypothetical protein